MLYRIEVENFYSIRDRQVIDLRARSDADASSSRLAPLWTGSDRLAPKVVAIFGANASGKTNLLRALTFLRWFVKDSFSADRDAALPFQRFNSEAQQFQATRLVVCFGGISQFAADSESMSQDCEYMYELTLGGFGMAPVLREALSYKPSDSLRKIRLFERNDSENIKYSKSFMVNDYDTVLQKILRKNASIISTLAQLNHPYSLYLSNIANSILSNIFVDIINTSDEQAVQFYHKFPNFVSAFNNEVQRIDLGIKEMNIQEGTQGVQALFEHHGLAHRMGLFLQSHGTRQFLKLYPILLTALEHGGIAIMDELDSAIHPVILPEIVRWFHDKSRNPRDAQLWMTLHNASMLEILSKDEVIFCEKGAQGNTEIYSLGKIQGVRTSDNFAKKYLGGVYGAIPRIG